MINQRHPTQNHYRLGEYLPRNLSKIPSYDVSFKQFVRFTNFQGIGLVKTLYLAAIIFVTAYSVLIIMKDWILGDPTRIILGLVFTSIFWFVSLILLRVMAECIISLIAVSHLVPILKRAKLYISYKKKLGISVLDIDQNGTQLTRIKREEDKEEPNFDIDQNYDLEMEYNPPIQLDQRGQEIENNLNNNKNEESENTEIEIDANEWNPYIDTSEDDHDISVKIIHAIERKNVKKEQDEVITDLDD